MEKYNNRIFQSMFSLLLILVNLNLTAQDFDFGRDSLKIRNFQENLTITTDRDIYITGEKVWVKVYSFNGLLGSLNDMSKVVYLELLDDSNNNLNQIKIWTLGGMGSSGFRLSDTLSSGNYQIRAYTKWMTNYSEDLFFYKTLTVVNPFKNIDRLIIPAGSNINDGTLLGKESQNLTKQQSIETANKISINAVSTKNEYTSRDKVEIDISVTDASGKPVESEMSLSVIKPFLLYRQSVNHSNGNDALTGISDSATVNLPEIEGPILSGIIKSTKTNDPLKNIDLSLSFVGKSARCQFVKTNDKGEFNFVIREQVGMSDLVIQPLSEEISDSYVEFTQPFCTTFSDKKPQSFYLDSTITEGINNAVIAMQVNNIYEPFRRTLHALPANENVNRKNFYGEPDRRILMSDYIELKDIREVVKEILPEVNVIKKNKKYNFKITNTYPYAQFENQALILVDGVPVYDIENLLNVSSKDLERIDVINRRYYFSDYIFDGILSFTTKKGDMSALESDKFVYRQVFEGYKPIFDFYSPDYGIDSLRASHLPDFRNTLYWNPDLKSNKEGKASAQFFTSDEPGEYTIILEGITSSGKRGFYSFPLKVK